MSIESLVNLDWQWLRVFNGSDSLFWDGFMATCTAGLTWLPMYLALAYMIVRNGDARKAAITIGGALACVLLVLGVFLYKEGISPKQLLGMAMCMGGLVLISR